jgi:hypothetical protein
MGSEEKAWHTPRATEQWSVTYHRVGTGALNQQTLLDKPLLSN